MRSILIIFMAICLKSVLPLPEPNSAEILNPTNAHQIMFAPVGTYATSTASLHVKITINADEYLRSINEYIRLLYININYKSHHNATMQLKNIIANAARNTLEDYRASIQAQLDLLPDHSIVKRQLGEIFGIAGFLSATYYGTRNAIEIQHIANNQHKIKEEQNFILDTIALQQKEITTIQSVAANITSLIEEMYVDNPAVFEAGVQRALFKAREGSEVITSALQFAQLKRLSSTLMPVPTVTALYKEIQVRAKTEGYQPLIEKMNDLFQLETSYLSGPRNKILLIVHVPLVKEGHKYQLLRFIPFPLSQTLAHNASITPKVEKDLLAIRTKEGQTEYKVLDYSDLIACDKIGNNYRCEGRNVLQTQLEDTCLGSLHRQNLQGVLDTCQFEVKTNQEHVFELSNRNFLISTPEPFHTSIECGEEAHAVKIEKLTKINVQGGCQVRLRQHIIRPERDLFADYKVIHFEWTWDTAELFPSIEIPEISNIINAFNDAGMNTINAHEIQQWRLEHLHEIPSHTGLFVASGVFILITIILVILSFYYKCRCYRWDSCEILPRRRHEACPQDQDYELGTELKDIQFNGPIVRTRQPTYPTLPSAPSASVEIRA